MPVLDGGRVALGEALRDSAGLVADAVLADWRSRAGQTDTSQTAPQMILAVCTLATQLIARWLQTGQAASDAERDELAATGRVTAQGLFSIVDLTKNYLRWRDATWAAIDAAAVQVGASAEVARTARRVVGHSCDASLVQVVREFEQQSARLAEQLAHERAKLAHLALHDPLTGLANRALLMERVENSLQRLRRGGQPATLLFVDLERFKDVNDTFGHDVGDQLLIMVAERLVAHVRDYDTVARLGGDEFVLLLEAPVDSAAVDRVRRLLAEPFLVGDLQVGASVGQIAATAGHTGEALLQAADAAMYADKRRCADRTRRSAG